MKLRPCTLNGANDLVRVSPLVHIFSLQLVLRYFSPEGLLQLMDSMDRSAIVYASARAEASESLGQIQALSREMAEFKEIHASTIDSLQFESKQIQSKLAEHRRAAETRQGSLGGSANLQEF